MVLHQPPYLGVKNHTVELPDGRLIENRAWLVTPGFINVVAVTGAGQWIMFRQTGRAPLAPVGGS